MRSYVQEILKNQYTSYLNKIEQYYKNLTFRILEILQLFYTKFGA